MPVVGRQRKVLARQDVVAGIGDRDPQGTLAHHHAHEESRAVREGDELRPPAGADGVPGLDHALGLEVLDDGGDRRGRQPGGLCQLHLGEGAELADHVHDAFGVGAAQRGLRTGAITRRRHAWIVASGGRAAVVPLSLQKEPKRERLGG
ncbi:hypothetical protein GCM10025876_16230 [Demequina litorisediminis]|uniref:Uncharacterized protein n=1 Tax=Demequina litorisediminis TaxID=1849022 RepID=A0ABQ6ICJ7_9MICO|nr:hypothetical protein GCM10025876_16230 [Demequina litorisediminis]